jgi:hypothetical protein
MKKLIICLMLTLMISGVASAKVMDDSLFTGTTVDSKTYNIKKDLRLLVRNIQSKISVVHNKIWNDEKFSPEEIMAGFGDDAKEVMDIYNGIQELLTRIEPTIVPITIPEGYTPSFDSKGASTMQLNQAPETKV